MSSRWITLALFCVIFLVSCGAEDSDLAEGGSTGTGISPAMDISRGSITAIGSISVNGVKFDTSNAKIIVEDGEVGIGDLAVLEHLATGQVVTVEGEINGTSGTALRVRFKNKIKGPVRFVEDEDVDGATKRLIVLSQTVIIDDNTVYKETSFDDVAVDNFVEVSGFIDDMGVIHATHLKKKADVFDLNEEVKVEGTISNLNDPPKTFQINELIVNYSSANELPPGGPAMGQFVEVKGMLNANDVLIATKVKLEDDIGADDADRLEIEGFVTAVDPFDPNPLNPVKEFTVGTQPVMTNADTQYEGGEPVEIALGVKLEVEGVLDKGILIADELSFLDNAKLKSLVATIVPDSPGSSAGTLTLQGLDGITVIVNELTKIKEDVQSFADIAPGDHVDVRGRTTNNTMVTVTASNDTPMVTVTAREIKVKKFDPNVPNLKVQLQGPVDVSEPFITILDITIDTSTVEKFKGVDHMEKLPREQFLEMVMPGDVVSADGHLQGHLQDPASSVVDWKKMELEDDD